MVFSSRSVILLRLRIGIVCSQVKVIIVSLAMIVQWNTLIKDIVILVGMCNYFSSELCVDSISVTYRTRTMVRGKYNIE